MHLIICLHDPLWQERHGSIIPYLKIMGDEGLGEECKPAPGHVVD